MPAARTDPKNVHCLHPLLNSSDKDDISFWDIVAKYRHEFLNSLFVRNTKLRHTILANSSSFHLNCWFPYYFRYFSWKKTTKFYAEYNRIQNSVGRSKTAIDLRGIGLSSIPLEAEHLIHLRDINFSYNMLTSVPQFLSILPNLTVLSLEGNYISSVFEDKMILPDTILVLNLNYNRIRIFPSSLKKLTNLKELHLKGNQIKRIKKGLKHLQNLEVLDMSYNLLEIIPDVFYNLKNLKVLCVQHNQLKTLPHSIQQLENLQILNISNNLMQNTTALQQIKNACKNIQKLNLSFNKNFDSSFYFQMDNLTELYLRGLALHQLPNNIIQLTELSILDLQDNAFTSFPEEIIGLTNLKILNFKQNKLQELHIDLHNLRKLTYLNLMGNQLQTIDLYPIGALSSLKKLNLNKNEQIQEVYAKGNEMIANISQCVSLEELYIYETKPLRGSALTDFLKAQKQLGMENMNFIYLPHLLLIGSHNVGKSSLAKWLASRFKTVDESIAKPKTVQFDYIAPTQGVEIKHDFAVWKTKGSYSKAFLSTWDFSGDTRFLPIQECFIGSTGYFILLFEWRKRYTQSALLAQWLRLIACKNENASVLLVGTYDGISSAEFQKAVHFDRQIFMQSMQNTFPNIENIFLVNTSAKSLQKASLTPNPLKKYSQPKANSKSKHEDHSPSPHSPSVEHVTHKRLNNSQLLELENHIFKRVQEATVPLSFIHFYEIIRTICRKRIIPAVSIDEVLLTAGLCNFNVKDKKLFLQVMLGCGILMEHSVVNNTLSTIDSHKDSKRSFFEPQWLANLLVTLHPSDLANYRVQGGIINDEVISRCWRQPHFPPIYHEKYFRILQEIGALFLIPKERAEEFGACQYLIGRGRFSTYQKAGAIALVPCNFSSKRPTDLLDETLQDVQLLKTSYFLIQPFAPPALISRIIVFLFKDITPSITWCDGCLFTVGNNQVLLEFIHAKNLESYDKDSLPSRENRSSVMIKISQYSGTGNEVEPSVLPLIEDCFLKITFCYYNNLHLSNISDEDVPAENLVSENTLATKEIEKTPQAPKARTSVHNLGQHREEKNNHETADPDTPV